MPWDNKDRPPQFPSHTLESVLHSKGSHSNEKPKHCNQRKAACSNKDPAQPKKKKRIYVYE